MNELFIHYNDVYNCIVDPSRQWMYMADRRSKEFIDGVHEFIEAAEKHKYGGFVRCPSTVTCSIVVSCRTTMFGPSMAKEEL